MINLIQVEQVLINFYSVEIAQTKVAVTNFIILFQAIMQTYRGESHLPLVESAFNS